MFPHTRLLRVLGHVSRDGQWGWDGACLEWPSDSSDDPSGYDAGDPNLYRYCGDKPTGAVDPTGLEWQQNGQGKWFWNQGTTGWRFYVGYGWYRSRKQQNGMGRIPNFRLRSCLRFRSRSLNHNLSRRHARVRRRQAAIRLICRPSLFQHNQTCILGCLRLFSPGCRTHSKIRRRGPPPLWSPGGGG